MARYAYSKVEPTQLELIERVPNTVWDADPRSFHHVGYWVADLIAASEQLEARGARRANHLSQSGARVELVSDTFEAGLVAWIRGE